MAASELVKSHGKGLKTQFFYPHQNESGYRWQGENARLASLCYALRQVGPFLTNETANQARAQAQHMIDWILGANPYQSCMMQGAGRNVAQYELAKFPHADGGICNGITSSLYDENDLAFAKPKTRFNRGVGASNGCPMPHGFC